MTLTVSSLLPRCHPHQPRPQARNHRRQHRRKHGLWQEPVIGCRLPIPIGRANIGAGPGEAVDLGRHDPAARGIEAEVRLYPSRNLDGIGRALRWLGRDRHHQQFGIVAHDLARDDHDDGSVLASVDFAPALFVIPQISVGQDVSRFGYRP